VGIILGNGLFAGHRALLPAAFHNACALANTFKSHYMFLWTPGHLMAVFAGRKAYIEADGIWGLIGDCWLDCGGALYLRGANGRIMAGQWHSWAG